MITTQQFYPLSQSWQYTQEKTCTFLRQITRKKMDQSSTRILKLYKPQVRNMFILGISRQFHLQETRYRQMLTVLYVKTIYCTFYKQNKQKK